MDWDQVHKLLGTVAHLANNPKYVKLRAAALNELDKIEGEMPDKPAQPAAADVKAAKASAPEPTSSIGEEPQVGVRRDVVDGLPGPAEKAETK